MSNINNGKRWGGFDWATEQREMLLIGAGGINSWTALNLARIGHSLVICDDDFVDETNVLGGQFFKSKQIGTRKVWAVLENCREFGCTNGIDCVEEKYSFEDIGVYDIFVMGVDNMTTRKQCFEVWKNHVNSKEEGKEKCLFIDGRLSGELDEVFAIQGDKVEQFEEYEKWLFDDSEIPEIDCTLKQTTFVAMNIASLITATLCNFLTNLKLGMEIREVPFHQKFYSASLTYGTN